MVIGSPTQHIWLEMRHKSRTGMVHFAQISSRVFSVKSAYLLYSSNAINSIFNGGSKERSVLIGGHIGLLGSLIGALNSIPVSIQFFTYSQIWDFLTYDPPLGYL